MHSPYSPLRYPGGKQVLARVLAHLIRINGREGGVYVEPYAGGGGAALALLYWGHVERILINDLDRRIHAFWQSILFETDAFVDLLHRTPLSVGEWRRERDIYQRWWRHSALRVGFATFYLNRCNRSGIIESGGPIGGQRQDGRWLIDARFNRAALEARIRRVAQFKERITLTCEDASAFLVRRVTRFDALRKTFVYLDPPYFNKGRDLYLNHYKENDHAALARVLPRKGSFSWVMSYDDVPQIRQLYRTLRQVRFDLGYSARACRKGNELLILHPGLVLPPAWARRIADRFIHSSTRHVEMPPAGARTNYRGPS